MDSLTNKKTVKHVPVLCSMLQETSLAGIPIDILHCLDYQFIIKERVAGCHFKIV